jgi:hypothetical protein
VIIWLASFPRSGNGFFRVISRTLFDREIYSIYPEKRMGVNKKKLKQMKQESTVYLVKTHELPPDSSPAIYLVRDGRDSLVSLAWFHLTSRTNPNRDISEQKFTRKLKREIRSKKFGGWSNNCQAWIQRPYQTTVVRFEDLTSQPEEVVANALTAVGLVPQRSERNKPPSFEELHQLNPFLYRKGKVGGWNEHMPEDLHSLFWEKHGEAMQLVGYKR